MCIASRKRNLDGQPVVTDSVYFIRNPACSNYGNTQGAPAPKKIDHLLQVRPLLPPCTFWPSCQHAARMFMHISGFSAQHPCQ